MLQSHHIYHDWISDVRLSDTQTRMAGPFGLYLVLPDICISSDETSLLLGLAEMFGDPALQA